MDRSAGQGPRTCEATRRKSLSRGAQARGALAALGLLAIGCPDTRRSAATPAAPPPAVTRTWTIQPGGPPPVAPSDRGASAEPAPLPSQSGKAAADEAVTPEPSQPWALFHRYPALAARIAVLPLAELPTPVERALALGRALGVEQLYVKRDDRASGLYGGNKVRKLEPELGAARAAGRRQVVTFGGVGSNHALATALFARRAGLEPILMLLPEPPTAHVRHNLLAEAAAGATMRLTSPAAIDALVARATQGLSDPSGPHLIEPGGSSTVGNVGFVNAAFELARQVAAGALPEPDALFIAMGTGGSAVGLAVGLRAAGLRTRVYGVRVSSDKYVNAERVRAMAAAVVELLRGIDPSFPAVILAPSDLTILHGYVGRGYALPTAEGTRILELARRTGALELDATYTAKTVAAIAGESSRIGAGVVLYWHTYDSREIDHGALTPRDLPAELRGYAETRR